MKTHAGAFSYLFLLLFFLSSFALLSLPDSSFCVTHACNCCIMLGVVYRLYIYGEDGGGYS